MNYRADPIPYILASITDLEARLHELRMTVHNLLIPQEDRISELESMADPYSRSGQAIGNYYAEEEYEP
jgi:hypothetical protein